MTDLSPITLVIAGAGAAGMACALAAAAQGANVVLVEKTAQLGGTVTQTLIHTLGGFFTDQGDLLNAGLSEALIERLMKASPFTCKRRIGKTWVLNVDPHIYQQVAAQWMKEYANIDIYYQTTVDHVVINASRIDSVTLKSNETIHTLHPQAVIDTTGRADIVRGIDAHLVTEGDALSGLIFQLRGVTPKAVQFPAGIALIRRIRKAVDNNELPPECATLWLDSGVYADEVYVKFNLMAAAHEITHMNIVVKQLLNFLHTQPDFSKATLYACGELGMRDSGRVQGEYTLTEADLKQGRRFSDAVSHASWPIEYWHPQQGVSLDYFPSGHTYQIPLSALKVKGFRNLYVAGKCLSAEPRAQASARVVGSCWAMGEGLVTSLLRPPPRVD